MSVEERLARIEAILEERDRRYEQRFTDSETATRAALAAAEKAVGKAEDESKEWRRGSNEWRGTLNDALTRMMTREEGHGIRDEATKMADRNTERIQELDGRADARFTAIEGRLNTSGGERAGSAATVRLLMGIGALVLTGIGIIAAVLAHG